MPQWERDTIWKSWTCDFGPAVSGQSQSGNHPYLIVRRESLKRRKHTQNQNNKSNYDNNNKQGETIIMWKQTIIALGLFEMYFTLILLGSGRAPDAIMLTANAMFAGWLAMEAMRVRLGHATSSSRTYGILSRSFLTISFLSVALAIADRGLSFQWGTSSLPSPSVAFGTLLFVSGVWLRHISIKTLGRFFVTKVQITDEHRLIKEGIYQMLRHPSYTGLILGFSGIILVLQSTAALAFFLALGVPAYLYRIRVEEAALLSVFGEEFTQYRSETYALLPFLY